MRFSGSNHSRCRRSMVYALLKVEQVANAIPKLKKENFNTVLTHSQDKMIKTLIVNVL